MAYDVAERVCTPSVEVIVEKFKTWTRGYLKLVQVN